jgi:hypothetical protein
MHVILALGKLKQKEHEFEDSLGYIARSCLKRRRRRKRRRRKKRRRRRRSTRQ